MGKVVLTVKGKNKIQIERGDTLLKAFEGSMDLTGPMAVSYKGEVLELSQGINEDMEVEAITLYDPIGVRIYMRTLIFVLVLAVEDVLKGARVVIEHSLSKGLYGEIYCGRPLNPDDIQKIKDKMIGIIENNEVIEKIEVKKDKAIDIFKGYGMEDKVRLLNYLESDSLSLYRCMGKWDYFYGPMLPSTGFTKLFDLIFYNPGFILLYPQAENPKEIKPFKDLPKLARIFKESEDWAKILDVADVGSLNDKVLSKDFKELVLISEGLHEKKIASIADKIYDNKEKLKIVLIAGPSSSGKTTFARRLSIQLKVLGLKPFPISLDDYFIDREKTPKDEAGNYDFESINALDLKLFNRHLSGLLKGEEIELPLFNFVTGKREKSGIRYRMKENSVLVIEGIHALNEKLTASILRENKYKIYVSALTQLNIDDHNRIPTTDIRIIRRIVRDYRTRGKSAEKTISTWYSVRRGEERYIFPYQEEADSMFNSTLVYEMTMFKKYAQPLLDEINIDSPAYLEAKRLLIFLRYFESANEDIVPNNSIMREFIGGSCFYD